MVLNFGSRGAVWSYNLFADALMMLFRLILWVVVGHFVDDFNGDEPEESAQSAFESVAELSTILGFPMSGDKAQSADRDVIRLGVRWQVTATAFVISSNALRSSSSGE